MSDDAGRLCISKRTGTAAVRRLELLRLPVGFLDRASKLMGQLIVARQVGVFVMKMQHKTMYMTRLIGRF